MKEKRETIERKREERLKRSEILHFVLTIYFKAHMLINM